jgi:hypothetical protein
MEWDHEHGCLVNGPDAQAEADVLELGYHVAQELHYQAVLGGHLPECIPAVGGGPECEAIRRVYGICPDHDPVCAPGCSAQLVERR